MKIAVYTAIIGGYDDPKPFIPQNVDCDYFLFTDNSRIPDQFKQLSPRMQAKWYKLHPHVLFPDYDLIIWVDGCAYFLSDRFVERMIKEIGDNEIMCCRHPENRNCIYDEAEYCKNMPKYVSQPIDNQVEQYKNDGYPRQNGLYACGIIVSKPTTNTKIFMGAWWYENVSKTYQDQLSFPYVSWKLKIPVKMCEINIYKNQYVEFRTDQHKSLL